MSHTGDMYHRKNGETEDQEPEWVKTEREQFKSFRDKNGDGHMDNSEVKDWILPTDYDHAEAEAKHLVYESDKDKVRLQIVGCITYCTILKTSTSHTVLS